MRISDWSSDVCSSDLIVLVSPVPVAVGLVQSLQVCLQLLPSRVCETRLDHALTQLFELVATGLPQLKAQCAEIGAFCRHLLVEQALVLVGCAELQRAQRWQMHEQQQ